MFLNIFSDLAAHCRGLVVGAAYTVLIPKEDGSVDDKAKNVTYAAWTAANLAARMLSSSHRSIDIAKAIQDVAKAHNVRVVDAVYSHNTSEYSYVGDNHIYAVPYQKNNCPNFEIIPNSYFCIDVAMSTGEGIAKDTGNVPTTVFANTGRPYQLRMNASKKVMSEVHHKFPDFPFSIRHLKSKYPRMGLNEAMKHGAIIQHPVLFEKSGEIVSQFKFYIMVKSNGPQLVGGLSTEPAGFPGHHKEVEEVYRNILITSLKKKKKKKKKKSKATS